MLQWSFDFRHARVGDLDTCRNALRAGSRTFYAASLLLPPSVRASATALYAFCRIADDIVDNCGPVVGVDGLRRRLQRIYAGSPEDHPSDRALADVVLDYGVPRELLEALLEGLEWDLQDRSYETLDDLNAYGARVAGTVGAMTCLLMKQRDAHVLARACDLGVAMQLTNIARDVGEDARMGRLYLPRCWMRDAGIDPDAWLKAPVFDDALATVIRRLLDAADELYHRADLGIPGLPFFCRPAIHAARYFYSEIGREIERAGLDSVSRRAVVADRRKALLVTRTLMAMLSPKRWISPPPLEQTQFLVDAAVANPLPARLWVDVDTPAWWDFVSRVERTIELFMRLQKSDQMGAEEATARRQTS